jgi:hypothetical protein
MIWYVSVKPSFAFYVGNKHKYYEVDKRFAALLDATTHVPQDPMRITIAAHADAIAANVKSEVKTHREEKQKLGSREERRDLFYCGGSHRGLHNKM